MTINIIAAIGRRGELGRDGDLVWHIREDLRRFRRLTTGHTVIMGRRTWQSLPDGPLPDRRNIVVSADPAFTAPGAETVHSIADAISIAADDSEIFIIGGGSVYSQSINAADRLYLTVIEAEAEDADTFFPPVDPAMWEIEEQEEPASTRDGMQYRFITLRRTDR